MGAYFEFKIKTFMKFCSLNYNIYLEKAKKMKENFTRDCFGNKVFCCCCFILFQMLNDVEKIFC